MQIPVERYTDFVKISWHIFLKDFVSYAASFRES